MPLRVEDPIPTRYSLLSRLQDREDQESWRDFFNTYWRLIYSTAIKSGLTEVEAQDAVQETVICVAKEIHKFKRDRSKGSFKGWLRNITRWRIADQLRRRKPRWHAQEPEDFIEPSPETLEGIADPAENTLESIWDQEWRTNLFEAAVDRVKLRVKEEQYQIFHFYVVKGWPVAKVAKTLRVSAASVYLAKHRISALIKKEIRTLEKELF